MSTAIEDITANFVLNTDEDDNDASITGRCDDDIDAQLDTGSKHSPDSSVKDSLDVDTNGVHIDGNDERASTDQPDLNMLDNDSDDKNNAISNTAGVALDEPSTVEEDEQHNVNETDGLHPELIAVYDAADAKQAGITLAFRDPSFQAYLDTQGPVELALRKKIEFCANVVKLKKNPKGALLPETYIKRQRMILAAASKPTAPVAVAAVNEDDADPFGDVKTASPDVKPVKSKPVITQTSATNNNNKRSKPEPSSNKKEFVVTPATAEPLTKKSKPSSSSTSTAVTPVTTIVNTAQQPPMLDNVALIALIESTVKKTVNAMLQDNNDEGVKKLRDQLTASIRAACVEDAKKLQAVATTKIIKEVHSEIVDHKQELVDMREDLDTLLHLKTTIASSFQRVSLDICKTPATSKADAAEPAPKASKANGQAKGKSK